MLTIRQFRFGSDNLAYVIHGEKRAIAVDGGATEDILSYLSSRNLDLVQVTNTHEHPDHTPGNQILLQETEASLLKPMDAAQEKKITLGGEEVRVYYTPGHTADSICFHASSYLITGDTLFNGTVGNCFSGDLKAFYDSIKRLMALSGDTIVYAGHDYVTYAMSFARLIEPANLNIDRFLEQYDPEHVQSTLNDELKINPYLRFNAPDMVRVLESKGLPVSTEYERWESVMSLG